MREYEAELAERARPLDARAADAEVARLGVWGALDLAVRQSEVMTDVIEKIIGQLDSVLLPDPGLVSPREDRLDRGASSLTERILQHHERLDFLTSKLVGLSGRIDL